MKTETEISQRCAKCGRVIDIRQSEAICSECQVAKHTDLLAALEQCVDMLERCADDAEECGYDQRAENARADIATARAAIAKARG